MLPIHQPISVPAQSPWARVEAQPGFTRWGQWSKRAALTVSLALTGCADLGYLVQSASGHLAMLRAAEPVEQWLGSSEASPELKGRLALAQQIRRFAVRDLGLPDNPSYTRYADLQRKAVVWNVVAAPVLSLTLQTWCFPVTGCVGYRGYFDEKDAKSLAAELQTQGLEVHVYGVPAYSTLGWLNWAGGDPLLNTFINYPDAELARLIFHELAHQVAFAKGDTMFNESFATAVERLGGARWLARQSAMGADKAGEANAGPTTDATELARRKLADFEATTVRRIQFRALTVVTRNALYALYKQPAANALELGNMTELKQAAYQRFRAQYAELRAGWVAAASLTPDETRRQLSGYDAWVANANNATFAAQAAYDELVPEFEALFAQSVRSAKATGSTESEWARFYDAVKRLAELPEAERRSQLKSSARALASVKPLRE